MFLKVFLFVVITAVVITFILPETFASVAKVKIEVKESTSYFSAEKIEIQKMQSEAVLGDVVNRLNLNIKWGRKYAGTAFTPNETLALLKHNLKFYPVRGAAIIEIQAFSDNPNEAAEIANAVAVAYQQQRQNVSAAEIMDPAVPNPKPVYPNKPRNIALGVLLGTMLGALTGGIATGIVSLEHRRRRSA